MTHVGEENKENQTQDKDEKEGGGRVLKRKEDKQKIESEIQSENCNREKSYE